MNNGKATIKRATAGVGTPLKKDTFSVIRLNLANRKAAPNGIKKPINAKGTIVKTKEKFSC